MKKAFYGRTSGFCLILIAVLNLCSCGGTAEKSGTDTALAKEHVYRFQEIAVPDLGGDEIATCASAYRNQTVSLLVKVTQWEDYNDNDIRVLRFREDGSDAAVSPLETIPWYPAAEDGADPSERSVYDNYTFGADGRIYAVRFFSQVPRDSEEEAASLRYLCCWAADGSLLWEAQLEDFGPEEEYIFLNAISVAEDGTASLIMTGERAWQITVDAQGTASDTRQLSDETLRTFHSAAAILHRADGTLLLVCYGEDNWEEQYLVAYDPATDTLGTSCRMPSSRGWDGCSAIAADTGSGILYGNRTGIYSYVPQDAEGVERMNFINSDLNVSNFDALVSLGDNSFAGVFYEGYSGEANMGVFTHVDPGDVPDRAILVLAGVYVSDDILQHVVAFNRSSDKYRIVVRNLEERDSDEALAADIAEMTSSVFSGNAPDILVTDGLPIETYAANGFLADVGTLIREDEELSRVEFLQNVFEAYAVDGKLYCLIPSFRVSTMIGAASIVGDGTSWTFADAAQLLETLQNGANLFPETDRASFLQTAITSCSGSFLDPGAGKCSFQTQDFLDILEYAKSLPEEPDSAAYGEDYWRNYEAQYREGRTLLAGMTLSSFDDAPYYVNDLFGEDVSYVGFPSGSGTGSYVKAEEAYAISSRSEHVEGAWEFLRYYLTDEYQSRLKTGLPVQKNRFLEKSRTALEKPQPHDPEAASGAPNLLTEEQLGKLVNFILSTDRRHYANEDVMNVVYEETGAFFSGDKTARETAEIIQRRVQLYLDENRK